MAIVRTISSSADFEKREKEKAKLEKAYRESDKQLDGLIAGHSDDLNAILQAFTTISGRISNSQQRIRSIKDNLQSCKNLLHCKRDELRKLWIEGIEHKTVVSMLDQIERIRDVPDRLQGYLERKHYLHATDLLVESVTLLEGDLAQVDALRDVRAELFHKKQELFDNLVDELQKQIYVKSTSSIVKEFQRSGSSRNSVRKVKDRLMYGKTDSDTIDGDVPLPKLSKMSLEEMARPRQIEKDLTADPEADAGQFIAVIIESLNQLERLPDATELIKSKIRPGLLAIVQRASQQVADNAYLEGEDISQIQQPEFLLELLELVFQEFRIVAYMHRMVLANLQRLVRSASPPVGDILSYDMVDVWSRIQAVVQMLLDDYLDVRNSATAQAHLRANFDEPSAQDMGPYFAKRRPARTRKGLLFRFDASSHAISMNSYFREQRQETYGAGEVVGGDEGLGSLNKPQLVCKPGASNITAVYKPLVKFVLEIEKAIGCPPGTSTINKFVTDFIKNVFLTHVHFNMQEGIEKATRSADAQRAIADPRVQKELGAEKPLLQSAVTMWHHLQELETHMHDLPDYADQFAIMMHKVLQSYKDKCTFTYKEIVSSDVEDKRIISGTWAKDEDISRLLRCLPNWQNLKELEGERNISEEDMHAMNCKESDILTSNLSSGDINIPSEEIISDHVQLQALGHLCESLEWLANRTHELIAALKPVAQTPTSSHPPEPPPPVSLESFGALECMIQELQDLGDLCLLVLHLEVRVHCFYYLLPMARQSNYSSAIDDMDPDSSVIKLNKDLASFEDSMVLSIQHKKCKYIFEGLGHLVASILINSSQFLKRVNENGIKKMCRNIFSVQQCLTNITRSRESDLDAARQYYEMLYLPADEILNTIRDKGAKFSQTEYVNLISLENRSRRGAREDREAELPNTMSRLNQILAEHKLDF